MQEGPFDFNPWRRTPPLPGPSPGDLVFSGAGSGCDEDECIPVFDTGSGDDIITPGYIPPTLPPVTKPFSGPDIPTHGVGVGEQPCDDEEDCYTGSVSGEFHTGNGVLTDGDHGDNMDLEFSATHHPILSPEVIHSEEHKDQTPPPHGFETTKKDPGSGPTTTSRPATVTPSRTTTTTTQPPRTNQPWATSTTPATPTSRPQPPPHTVAGYDYDDHAFENGEKSDVKEDRIIVIDKGVGGSIALIISIIVGVLIIVILIILIILKYNGHQEGTYTVDESKNYEGISTMPTPMINGQGNDAIKPGDRRPVKKQSKDGKEWYV